MKWSHLLVLTLVIYSSSVLESSTVVKNSYNKQPHCTVSDLFLYYRNEWYTHTVMVLVLSWDLLTIRNILSETSLIFYLLKTLGEVWFSLWSPAKM